MRFKLIMAAALAALSTGALSNPILGTTCGEFDREATLSGAEYCAYAPTLVDPIFDPNGTMKADDIAHFYGAGWVSAGELTGNGTDDYLSAVSDEGWGNIPNSGDWAIASNFWDVYDKAVITMHVGGGQDTPDNWAWLLTDGEIGGITADISIDSWSLVKTPPSTTGGGGGVSNIKLWGLIDDDFTITSVPEPDMLFLLSIGLLGIVVAQRSKYP